MFVQLVCKCCFHAAEFPKALLHTESWQRYSCMFSVILRFDLIKGSEITKLHRASRPISCWLSEVSALPSCLSQWPAAAECFDRHSVQKENTTEAYSLRRSSTSFLPGYYLLGGSCFLIINAVQEKLVLNKILGVTWDWALFQFSFCDLWPVAWCFWSQVF